MNSTIVFIVIVALALFFIVPQVFGASGRISGEEARKLASEGALVVDVRTPAEYAQGHVQGAVNIPVQDLGRRLGELGAPEGEIVLYCRSGARSGQALRVLTEAGFKSVHDVGAMSRWK